MDVTNTVPSDTIIKQLRILESERRFTIIKLNMERNFIVVAIPNSSMDILFRSFT